jgi:protein O-mannosyl-transferase
VKKKRRKAKPGGPKPAQPPNQPRKRGTAESLLSPGRLAVLLALLAVAPFLNTFSNTFVLDDVPIIVENPLIRNVGNIGKIFTTNYWGEEKGARDRGLYRPLTVWTYAFDYAFWGLKPGGYHLVNLALHVAATLMLFVIAMSILESSFASFVACSIFAVHPIHTEAVTGIVGRAELLATLFFMLAFWVGRREGLSWLHGRLNKHGGGQWVVAAAALSGLLYLLGMFSKETAVTLPALLLVYELARNRRDSSGDDRAAKSAPKSGPNWMVYPAFGLALGIYLAIRSNVVVSRNVWVGFVGVPVAERMLTASRVLMEYLALLVYPATLSADYWRPDVPIARSPGEPLVLLSIFLWLALGGTAFFSWRRSLPIFFGLAWFFITIAPVSNFLITIGVGKAERILYLPSAGFCLVAGAVAGSLDKRFRRGKVLLLAALIPILVLFVLRTLERNEDWKDSLTLAKATLRVSPTSPLFNQIAAAEYRKLGDNEKAVPLLKEAISQRPEEYTYHYNLGNAYLDLKQYDLAIASYREVLRLNPNFLEALNNLGQAQMEMGNTAEAVKTYTTLLSMDPTYEKAYLNLGAAQFNLENLAEAARVLREGLARFPNSGVLHLNLAAVLNKMGQGQEAGREYQKAVVLDPSLKESN